MNVIIKGSLSSPSQELRSLVANNSKCTCISQRLAKQLGLIHYHDVYVRDILGYGGDIVKWKRSIYPIIIYIPELDNVSIHCYPIINCNKNDAYWEMIIGQDVLMKNFSGIMQCYNNSYQPTAGPSYDDNTFYLGHNIGYANINTIVERNISEYIELQCFNSKSISRLAINNKKKTIIVKYITSNDDIYSYKKVPKQLIMNIIQGDSKGKILSDIKKVCEFTKPNIFPDTIMIYDDDNNLDRRR